MCPKHVLCCAIQQYQCKASTWMVRSSSPADACISHKLTVLGWLVCLEKYVQRYQLVWSFSSFKSWLPCRSTIRSTTQQEVIAVHSLYHSPVLWVQRFPMWLAIGLECICLGSVAQSATCHADSPHCNSRCLADVDWVTRADCQTKPICLLRAWPVEQDSEDCSLKQFLILDEDVPLGQNGCIWNFIDFACVCSSSQGW